MNRKTRLRLIALVTIVTVLLIEPVQAQDTDDTCPEIVEQALDAVDRFCLDTGRNQACYGNANLEAEPQPGFDDLAFDKPGDIVAVQTIHTIRSSPLDGVARRWGVALLRIQANLPDTLPGQNVSMLLFGDVEIQNPPDTEDAARTPLQAFYFRSGIGDAPCAAAPNSGILIQTPEGVGEIVLNVNEVKLRLSSTAYLQAEPGHEMRVTLIDGRGQVEALDVARTILPGTRVRIPLDDRLSPSGPPDPLEKCDEADLQGLPLEKWSCQQVYLLINDHCPATIPFGMDVLFHFGAGFDHEDLAQAALDEAVSSLTINGQSMPIVRYGPYYVDHYDHYAYGNDYEWKNPDPGTYRVVSHDQNQTMTCRVTILDSR